MCNTSKKSCLRFVLFMAFARIINILVKVRFFLAICAFCAYNKQFSESPLFFAICAFCAFSAYNKRFSESLLYFAICAFCAFRACEIFS